MGAHCLRNYQQSKIKVALLQCKQQHKWKLPRKLLALLNFTSTLLPAIFNLYCKHGSNHFTQLVIKLQTWVQHLACDESLVCQTVSMHDYYPTLNTMFMCESGCTHQRIEDVNFLQDRSDISLWLGSPPAHCPLCRIVLAAGGNTVISATDISPRLFPPWLVLHRSDEVVLNVLTYRRTGISCNNKSPHYPLCLLMFLKKVVLFKRLLLDLLISIHPLSLRLPTLAHTNLINSSADSHKASNSPATAP